MLSHRALVPQLPRKAWILLGGDALSAIGSGLTLPFFLVYLHRVRDIDLELAALALSVLALAGLAGNPIGGSLSDRFGARNTLVFGLLVAAVGAASVVFVRTAWQAFGAAGIVGFGGAVIWPAQDALLARVVDPAQRSAAFSVRHATLNAGFGIGGVVAALIVDTTSPASFELIYVLDALSFIAFIPILLGVNVEDRAAQDHDPSVRLGYRDILKDKVFIRIWALMALLVVVGYAQYHAAFPAYATGPGHLSARALGFALAANTFVVVFAQLVVLKLMNHRRRTRGVIVLCGFWAAAWAVTLIGGEFGGGLSMFVFAMVLLGIGETLLSPTMPAIVNDLAPESLRGRYNGAFTLAWTTGFIVGPAVAGVALAAGLGGVLLVGLAASCALAALVAFRLERHLPAHVNVVGGVFDEPDASLTLIEMTSEEVLL